MQIDLHLSPCTKLKSKGIKELNITTEEKWVEIIQHLKNIDDYEEAAFSRPSKEAHIWIQRVLGVCLGLHIGPK